MTTRVTMPQLGESVVEGTVNRWLKQQGDAVSEYESLVEVSTDKVDTEIPAPASGVVLKIYVEAGQTVSAGTLLAVIGQPGDETDTEPARVPAVAHAETNGKRESTTGHVTPVVARMAAEHNLDLSQIEGTGRGGRVTKKDVVAYLQTQEAETPAWEQPGAGELFRPTEEYVTDAAKPQRVYPVEPIPAGSPGELLKLSGMRSTIAEHMVRSKQTSPHVTTVFEADMSAVLAHREAHHAEFATQGVNLTLTAYFVQASVAALRAHPAVNAQWRDDGIFRHNAQHIGIAVALEDGLIVPVIKNAQDLNLLGIARAVNDLATRARNKQLQPDETQGGTFTITNHGVTGSLFATPVINQPQAAILGVGVIEKRVKVIDDAIAIRPLCYLSLTFDHRLIDGAVADMFMVTLKDMLEGWR